MNREEIRWQQRLANYNRALYQLESAVFLSIARQGAMDSRGKPYPPCTASLRPRASPWDYFFLYLAKAQSRKGFQRKTLSSPAPLLCASLPLRGTISFYISQSRKEFQRKTYPPCTASLRLRASAWDYFFLYLTKAQSHQPDLLEHIDRVGKLLYQSEKDVEKQ